MTTKAKVRVQGVFSPEVAAAIHQRATEGRRPVSRELEYLVILGLKADDHSAA
jgi:hypothetical protein